MNNNAFFKNADELSREIEGYEIPLVWWSRLYEYPWALKYARPGMIVADMGCGYEQRPFKNALSKICGKVYCVDQHWEMRNLEKSENMEFVVANFTSKIAAIDDNSLDAIFCISVLEEVRRENTHLALGEFYRCLKSGGFCLLTMDVQYDMDKPTPYCGGVDMKHIENCAKEIGFVFDEFDYDKSNAMYSEMFNLCVFHCEVTK